MSDQLHYKGYVGSIHFDDEGVFFWGKLEYIRAVVSYEATTARALVKEFRAAVDDYLATCEAEGIEPEIPFKGQLSVRIPPELHRDLAVKASRENLTINAFIKQALLDYVSHEQIAGGHR